MGKDCDCPPPGAPAWMATFGDLMSLLLCFFILIVSFSSIQEVEFQKAMGSLQGALGVLPYNSSTIALTDLQQQKLSYHQLAVVRPELDNFNAFLDESDLSDEVNAVELPESIKFTLKDDIVFGSGQSRVKVGIYPVLRKILDFSKKLSGRLRIEGHTDNVPIRTRNFPSNWELSSSRAVNVLHYFENMGMPSNKLSCIGYADTRPLTTNDSAAGRARNRRVEIYLEYYRDDGDAPDVNILEEQKFIIPVK